MPRNFTFAYISLAAYLNEWLEINDGIVANARESLAAGGDPFALFANRTTPTVSLDGDAARSDVTPPTQTPTPPPPSPMELYTRVYGLLAGVGPVRGDKDRRPTAALPRPYPCAISPYTYGDSSSSSSDSDHHNSRPSSTSLASGSHDGSGSAGGPRPADRQHNRIDSSDGSTTAVGVEAGGQQQQHPEASMPTGQHNHHQPPDNHRGGNGHPRQGRRNNSTSMNSNSRKKQKRQRRAWRCAYSRVELLLHLVNTTAWLWAALMAQESGGRVRLPSRIARTLRSILLSSGGDDNNEDNNFSHLSHSGNHGGGDGNADGDSAAAAASGGGTDDDVFEAFRLDSERDRALWADCLRRTARAWLCGNDNDEKKEEGGSSGSSSSNEAEEDEEARLILSLHALVAVSDHFHATSRVVATAFLRLSVAAEARCKLYAHYYDTSTDDNSGNSKNSTSGFWATKHRHVLPRVGHATDDGVGIDEGLIRHLLLLLQRDRLAGSAASTTSTATTGTDTDTAADGATTPTPATTDDNGNNSTNGGGGDASDVLDMSLHSVYGDSNHLIGIGGGGAMTATATGVVAADGTVARLLFSDVARRLLLFNAAIIGEAIAFAAAAAIDRTDEDYEQQQRQQEQEHNQHHSATATANTHRGGRASAVALRWQALRSAEAHDLNAVHRALAMIELSGAARLRDWTVAVVEQACWWRGRRLLNTALAAAMPIERAVDDAAAANSCHDDDSDDRGGGGKDGIGARSNVNANNSGGSSGGGGADRPAVLAAAEALLELATTQGDDGTGDDPRHHHGATTSNTTTNTGDWGGSGGDGGINSINDASSSPSDSSRKVLAANQALRECLRAYTRLRAALLRFSAGTRLYMDALSPCGRQRLLAGMRAFTAGFCSPRLLQQQHGKGSATATTMTTTAVGGCSENSNTSTTTATPPFSSLTPPPPVEAALCDVREFTLVYGVPLLKQLSDRTRQHNAEQQQHEHDQQQRTLLSAHNMSSKNGHDNDDDDDNDDYDEDGDVERDCSVMTPPSSRSPTVAPLPTPPALAMQQQRQRQRQRRRRKRKRKRAAGHAGGDRDEGEDEEKVGTVSCSSSSSTPLQRPLLLSSPLASTTTTNTNTNTNHQDSRSFHEAMSDATSAVADLERQNWLRRALYNNASTTNLFSNAHSNAIRNMTGRTNNGNTGGGDDDNGNDGEREDLRELRFVASLPEDGLPTLLYLLSRNETDRRRVLGAFSQQVHRYMVLFLNRNDGVSNNAAAGDDQGGAEKEASDARRRARRASRAAGDVEGKGKASDGATTGPAPPPDGDNAAAPSGGDVKKAKKPKDKLSRHQAKYTNAATAATGSGAFHRAPQPLPSNVFEKCVLALHLAQNAFEKQAGNNSRSSSSGSGSRDPAISDIAATATAAVCRGIQRFFAEHEARAALTLAHALHAQVLDDIMAAGNTTRSNKSNSNATAAATINGFAVGGGGGVGDDDRPLVTLEVVDTLLALASILASPELFVRQYKSLIAPRLVGLQPSSSLLSSSVASTMRGLEVDVQVLARMALRLGPHAVHPCLTLLYDLRPALISTRGVEPDYAGIIAALRRGTGEHNSNINAVSGEAATATTRAASGGKFTLDANAAAAAATIGDLESDVSMTSVVAPDNSNSSNNASAGSPQILSLASAAARAAATSLLPAGPARAASSVAYALSLIGGGGGSISINNTNIRNGNAGNSSAYYHSSHSGGVCGGLALPPAGYQQPGFIQGLRVLCWAWWAPHLGAQLSANNVRKLFERHGFFSEVLVDAVLRAEWYYSAYPLGGNNTTNTNARHQRPYHHQRVGSTGSNTRQQQEEAAAFSVSFNSGASGWGGDGGGLSARSSASSPSSASQQQQQHHNYYNPNPHRRQLHMAAQQHSTGRVSGGGGGGALVQPFPGYGRYRELKTSSGNSNSNDDDNVAAAASFSSCPTTGTSRTISNSNRNIARSPLLLALSQTSSQAIQGVFSSALTKTVVLGGTSLVGELRRTEHRSGALGNDDDDDEANEDTDFVAAYGGILTPSGVGHSNSNSGSGAGMVRGHHHHLHSSSSSSHRQQQQQHHSRQPTFGSIDEFGSVISSVAGGGGMSLSDMDGGGGWSYPFPAAAAAAAAAPPPPGIPSSAAFERRRLRWPMTCGELVFTVHSKRRTDSGGDGGGGSGGVGGGDTNTNSNTRTSAAATSSPPLPPRRPSPTTAAAAAAAATCYQVTGPPAALLLLQVIDKCDGPGSNNPTATTVGATSGAPLEWICDSMPVPTPRPVIAAMLRTFIAAGLVRRGVDPAARRHLYSIPDTFDTDPTTAVHRGGASAAPPLKKPRKGKDGKRRMIKVTIDLTAVLQQLPPDDEEEAAAAVAEEVDQEQGEESHASNDVLLADSRRPGGSSRHKNNTSNHGGGCGPPGPMIGNAGPLSSPRAVWSPLTAALAAAAATPRLSSAGGGGAGGHMSPPPPPPLSLPSPAPDDRQFILAVESSIVKLLKAAGAMPHAELFTAVGAAAAAAARPSQQQYHYTAQAFKAAITHLVERDFVRRDEETECYVYVP